MSDYSDKIKFNDHWLEYLSKTFEYKYNWCVGAYRSGKSVFNTLAFALYLENSEDKIHLVIASTTATAKAIVEDGAGFGLQYYFGALYQSNKKYKGQDAGYLKTKNGIKIIVYVGGENVRSFQSFRGWSCGSVVLEELNLLHQNTINEAKGRILFSNNPKMFISHNPVNKSHPIYKWLAELQTAGIVNFNRSTIFENPGITEKRRNEIIKEFDPDSIFYKQYILGQDVNAAGSIYNVRDYNIIDDYNPNDYLRYITICDFGNGKSATGIVVAGITKDKITKQLELHILKEYWHVSDDKNLANKKFETDYCKDYAQFIKDAKVLFNKNPEYVLFDGPSSSSILTQRNLNMIQLGYLTPKFVIKEQIENRIPELQDLLYLGKLRIYKGCVHCIDDLKNQIYDEKTYERTGKILPLKEYNEEGHSDMVDCISYAISQYKSLLINVY